MESLENLLSAAEKCRFCQPDLLQLGATLPPDDAEVDRLFDLALEHRRSSCLSNLMFAALLTDRPVAARHLETGAVVFEDINFMFAIAGKCSGDVPAAMLKAIKRGHLSWERECLALFIAAWHCRRNDQSPPEALITEARLLSRRVQSFEARPLLLASAHLLDDEGYWQTLDPNSHSWLKKTAEDIALTFSRQLERSVWSAVPKLPPPTVLQGYTVKRAVEKVGRNEPCPCGSGKKYKRCCFEQDQERLRDSSDIPGVTRQQIVADPEAYLDLERLEEMRSYELTALDPTRIPANLHWDFLSRLTLFKEFEAFLGFLEANGINEDIGDQVLDAVEEAVGTGELDFARRLAAYIPDFEFEPRETSLSFRFVSEGHEIGPTIKLIEEEALKIIDDKMQTDFICHLIDIGCPALAILAGRGFIARGDLWEAEVVLNYMLEARDRLNLPPSDPGEELFDERLIHLHHQRESEAKPPQGSTDSGQLRESTAKIKALEKKLRAIELREKELVQKQERQLQQMAEPTSSLKKVDDVKPTPPVPDAELTALRAERASLKNEAKQYHEERNHFRREFLSSNAELASVQQENALIRSQLEANRDHTDADLDDAPELLSAEAVGTRNPVRVPRFSERFTAGLGGVPDDIARKSIHLAGRLAAGEAAAFHGVKRLSANRDLLRQRIGAYRLLFKMDNSELLALELVHRRELEPAILRNS